MPIAAGWQGCARTRILWHGWLGSQSLEHQTSAWSPPRESDPLDDCATAIVTTHAHTRRRFASPGLAAQALFKYIEVFYNERCRHSTLGQINPATFERRA